MNSSKMVSARCLLVFLICVNISPSFGCGRKERPRDHAPPSISSCPSTLRYDADSLQMFSSKVQWTEPTAWDSTVGNVGVRRTQGLGPGQIFYGGNHTIEYMAKDNSGNTATCRFIVTVVVKNCKRWSSFPHGRMSCDPSNIMLVGTVCKFNCHPGYRLQGSNTTECQAHDQWSISSQPVCIPLTCDRLFPADRYTSIFCIDACNFQSVCQYSCTNGFDILPGHGRVRTCNASGKWTGEEPICQDVTPPVFTHCPSVLVFYAGKSTDATMVHWQAPVYTDNAGLGGTTSRQDKGPTSSTAVQLGEYKVVYQAWDDANNTATCEIQVTVKPITCRSLYPRPYTKITCPDGRRYGAQCEFNCKEGAVLKGESTVHCEAFNASGVWYGKWTFGLTQPYCEPEAKCLRPTPPEHGALSCDTWAGGAYCVLQCQKGYVIEDWEFDPLIMCSDTRGEFLGLDDDGTLPNCAVESGNSFFDYKLEEYYYYVGDCTAARDQIKQNFIKSILASLGNVCSTVNCSTSYVEVDCFNTTDPGRKRRSTESTVLVSVVLTVSVEGPNKLSPADIIMMKEQIHKTRAENNDGLHLEQGSLLQFISVSVSNPDVTCPPGSYSDRSTLKCVLCSKGTYHDVDANKCRSCPRGQYQPTSGQTACLACPAGQSTPDVASVDANQCVDECPPGYVSPTGTKPCSMCEVGTFNPSNGQTQCNICPGSMATPPNFAATTSDDCFDFDLGFLSDTYPYANASVLFTPTSHCTSLYLSLWMKCSMCDRILEITDAHEQSALRVETRNGFVYISIRGCELSVPVYEYLDSYRWHHMAFDITIRNITIAVDGTNQQSTNTCGNETILEPADYMLIIGGHSYVGSVTKLNIWDTRSGSMEMNSEPSCSDDKLGNLVAWKQFQQAEGPVLQTVSQCDDEDNCESSPCQNEGICLDRRDTFTCTCKNGFTGDMCEVNIEDCVGHSCQNGGLCLDGEASYTCLCKSKFTGEFCEAMIVDGGWTSWGSWGPCSVTCDSGQQTRGRECSSPEPENGGANCIGYATDSQICSPTDACVYECDVDPPDPLHGSMNCSWQRESTRQCLPFCEVGYAFDSDLFLDNIVCGPDTGYEWNIRNEENPDLQIGSCSVIKLAEKNTMIYVGAYENLTLEVARSAQTNVTTVIRSAVQTHVDGLYCAHMGYCRLRSLDVTNAVPGTTDIQRQRRDVPLVGFHIEISCTPKQDPSWCYDLLVDVYNTFQRLVSESQFSVLIDNTRYDIGPNGTQVDGGVECPLGTIQIDYFCVQCGPGSYPLNNYCERCPRGTYKEDYSSPGCTPCPPDWTTEGLRSRHASMCNVAVSSGKDAAKHWIYAVIVPCLMIVIVLTSVGLYICSRRTKIQQTSTMGCPCTCEKVNSLAWYSNRKRNDMWRKTHIPVAWPETKAED
ncbi:uncharacterized protein LOC127838823 [Dreissena polymorpha]|uniref:Sushi, von Willebrand factor type A, EGF and pentraxin domain-containing protein 1-like n=1 Tax=Dreissena polymorpha TaxID=45954 RepID=A0A9D4F3Q7_DREPO|nr:uncharacterized protein LOC127838823 [Dreissena polymorpha]KAH3791232.1 hypothetical protein DPMN_144714 [Dreissena polymorpha]